MSEPLAKIKLPVSVDVLVALQPGLEALAGEDSYLEDVDGWLEVHAGEETA